MEQNGKIGHSCILGFYSDGDGDFRPSFSYRNYPLLSDTSDNRKSLKDVKPSYENEFLKVGKLFDAR